MNLLSADLDHILEHTRPLWDEFKNQRIFITGGTGFFGAWLLESFLWANQKLQLNAQAVVLTRNPKQFAAKCPHLVANPALSFHVGNVQDFIFPTGEFSHVIHAATEASAQLNVEYPLLMLDTIVQGTRRVLEFAALCGAQRFLLTSSGAVYGRQPPDMAHLSEDYSGMPAWHDPKAAYGVGKYTAEHMSCLYAAHCGLDIKIARCFAFVGPYLPLDIHFAIGNFIRDALKGGPIIINGDGSPYRSYLYAADLMIWLWTILCRGKTMRPYNVGSDEAFSIGELAHLVASTFSPRIEVKVMQTPRAGVLPERYVPGIKRAREELQLAPQINLVDAIQATKNWYLNT